MYFPIRKCGKPMQGKPSLIHLYWCQSLFGLFIFHTVIKCADETRQTMKALTMETRGLRLNCYICFVLGLTYYYEDTQTHIPSKITYRL
ncbi:hypothetical protein BDZ94DRAFT_1027896 [Collybia nuda]|uniref:Uncharacterized protein n=1 Tax=Collybia nuda TaxID=64659 RepID=A0A9P5YC10_9AGAR|nr:hypothetical protein BDZ94DRAFT_1027896 [Collybia nuda]